MLNHRVLGSVPISAADPAERQPIAGLLAALDDKIAVNCRVVESAEALMTTLAGRVAEYTTLANVAQRSSASIQPGKLADNVALYSFPAFDHDQRPIMLDANVIRSVKFLVEHPCVLFAKLNPGTPRIWNIPRPGAEPGLASSEFVVLRPIGVDTSVLWSALRQPEVSSVLARLAAGMTGSRQRIRPRELLDVRVRDVRCLDSGSAATITTLGAVCEQRRAESAALAAMRDRLLPLLISGAVRARDHFVATSAPDTGD
ncbi:hypothetical protein IWGMT90018_38710 [Mycobacterium kiyosense]|nr:hypothetical protein IWGMT90018_38710 [Mycobacterium kiyosense]